MRGFILILCIILNSIVLCGCTIDLTNKEIKVNFYEAKYEDLHLNVQNTFKNYNEGDGVYIYKTHGDKKYKYIVYIRENTLTDKASYSYLMLSAKQRNDVLTVSIETKKTDNSEESKKEAYFIIEADNLPSNNYIPRFVNVVKNNKGTEYIVVKSEYVNSDGNIIERSDVKYRILYQGSFDPNSYDEMFLDTIDKENIRKEAIYFLTKNMGRASYDYLERQEYIYVFATLDVTGGTGDMLVDSIFDNGSSIVLRAELETSRGTVINYPFMIVKIKKSPLTDNKKILFEYGRFGL